MTDQNEPVGDTPDLSALLGGAAAGGAMPDLGGLMAQAQQMLAGAQEAAEEVVEGSAGGGKVKVEVDGGFNFQSVTIDPSVVDPEDVELSLIHI